MDITSKYMMFDMVLDTGKTQRWAIISKSSGFLLGEIKWFGEWRQYCFFPSQGTVFNGSCLDDIQKVIKSLMDARKK